MSGQIRRCGIAGLLDEDPDLAAGIDESELEAARRQAIVAMIEVDPAKWDPTDLADQVGPGWLGLLVVDGLILRRVGVGPRAACEILGRGDLLRPWDAESDHDPLAVHVSWLVLRPARLAVLDAAFARRTARWPVIHSGIVSRVSQRARSLARTQAVTHVPRAHARLLLLFWLLAERWGTVSSKGVHVTLPVTHDVLALLVGAQRPTVTLALQKLSRADLVQREPPERWLVTRRAIETLGQPERLQLVVDAPGLD